MPLQFFEFYQTTIDKWWGRPYLKREFFHRIGADMGDEVLLVIAEEDGETVAAALNLIGRYATCVTAHGVVYSSDSYQHRVHVSITSSPLQGGRDTCTVQCFRVACTTAVLTKRIAPGFVLSLLSNCCKPRFFGLAPGSVDSCVPLTD